MPLTCKGVLNPLTGVCVEKENLNRPEGSLVVKSDPAAGKIQIDDYQLGPYCRFMEGFNQSRPLTELAYAYDAVFEAAEKINEHTLQHVANAFRFESSLTVAAGATYVRAAYKNLREIMNGSSFQQMMASRKKDIAKALTTGALKKDIPFKMALMAWLMFSGWFRGPDEVIDNLGGERLSGYPRKAAYWTTWLGELAAAYWFFAKEYGETFGKNSISRSAKVGVTAFFAAFSAYMYGRTDQRESLRLKGEDPELGDNPLNWTWDGYNPNRYSSDWAAGYIGAAVFWANAPKLGRRIADRIYAKFGMPDYYETGLKFSAAEKSALLTAQERTFLAQASLWRDVKRLNLARLVSRSWTGIKWLGRALRTAGWRRFVYSGVQMFSTTLFGTMPLARIEQKEGREIAEDEYKTAKGTECRSDQGSATLHGVSNRTLLSALANNLVFAPLRWSGLDLPMIAYFAPGMVANYYPANSCNEYRGVPNQMALVHLERFRQAVTPSQKAHEKALFQFNFALANREDQEKAIQKFTHPSYFEEVRALFEPFLANHAE